MEKLHVVIVGGAKCRQVVKRGRERTRIRSANENPVNWNESISWRRNEGGLWSYF